MLQLLKNSYRDFLNTYQQYLVFEFLYLVMTSFLFVPIIAYIFNRMLLAMGSSSLLNSELFKIGLSFEGIIGLSIISIIAVIIIFVELGVLIIISHKAYFHKDISVFEAVVTTVRKIPKLFRLSIMYLIILLLLLIPLIEFTFSSTLLESIDIPVFMMERIANSQVFMLLYGIGFVLVIYLFIRWIFTLHFIVIEDKSTREAIKGSLELTKNNKISILIALLLLNFLISLVVVAAASAISFIPTLIDINLKIRLVENYLLTLSSFFAYVFALLLTPINIIFITRLYYRFKQRQGWKLTDNLTTSKDSSLRRMEEQAFSFFRTRKRLFLAVVLINLVGTLGISYYISDDVINLGRNIHIAAHRGDKLSAPENSLSSIRAALEKEIDFVEIDVQLTKDGVVVLAHDLDLKRVAGAPLNVSELTYAEIAGLDIGYLFAEEFNGERIPTLAEALQEVKGQAKLLVDLKPYGYIEELANKVVDLVQEYNMVNQVYIQSFEYKALEAVRRANSEIKIGQILFLAAGDLSAFDVDFYTIEQSMLSHKFIRDARQNNREVWVWTVNKESDIKEVLKYDIDGIITDYPDRVKKQLELRPTG